MKKYKILGLTGQTGAGKSTVSKVFAKNGTAVINADELVAELYMPDSVCLKILSAEFGSDIILPNKNLDRKKLAQRAFAFSANLSTRLYFPFSLKRRKNLSTAIKNSLYLTHRSFLRVKQM